MNLIFNGYSEGEYVEFNRVSVGKMRDADRRDSTLGLGELAQLTVNNDAEVTYDVCIIILFYFQ